MASSAELSGRRILVAGATGGIGLAVARRLAAAGAQLILVARRTAPLEAAAAETGGTAVAGDISDLAFVETLRAGVTRGGDLDALVNAAGDFDLAPVATTSAVMFRRMVDANLTAPFFLMRAFLPAMLEARRGHIVTVGSVAGRVAFPGNGAYSASKFGVRGLHAVLEQELRGTGVRCTLLEPGATDTGIWDPLDPDGRADLPGRDVMLSGDAVADAVHYALTRPPDVLIPTLPVQRS
jgi:NADP-dependent 3-hydroxy acid dehydrogenase YdfG